jgi:bifunctional non-homologous end joining protein LigD
MQKLKPQFRLGFVEPCIPTRASKVPVGPQWIHALKHDGYRLIVKRYDKKVRLFTRGGFDWTNRYPRIVEAVSKLRVNSLVMDGEAMCVDAKGPRISTSCTPNASTMKRFCMRST